MEKDRVLAEKVLEYWFALEFFSQDKFPDHREIENRIKKQKQKAAAGRRKTDAIENFILLRGKNTREDLYQVISREANACGMKKWGNLTFYIGKAAREKCIDCIADVLPFAPEDGGRPEKNTDQIAWASLQLSPEGNYIRHSLSLSAIIWALNQVKSAGGNLSDALDEKQYANSVKELEELFFDTEDPAADGEREEDGKTMQTFSAGAVSLTKLHNLYQELEKRYIKGNLAGGEENCEEVYGISFQLFADGAVKDKKEEDNYLGLAHDYFSDDIKFVLEQVRNGGLGTDCPAGKDLLRYVTVLKESGPEKKRIDLVNPNAHGKLEYRKQIQEILSVENGPLGKWPSRFMPAFMQQTAINLAIRKGTSKLYGVNGNIFSVNGPPGTGKTTLLKEIVVSNVVERAILLSEYENPGEAFQKHDFLHGEGPKNAYSQFTRHWYSLKNDEINLYSMLVTSCNNAAVENISKELPKKISGDLSPLEGDPEALREALAEVAKLFDPKESEMVEKPSFGEEYSDIYFTKYARNLLDNEEVWGLAAAPLGRKSNLNHFYQQVLKPLGFDFYKSNEMVKNRLETYKQARTKFLEQLEIVRGLQASLKRAGDLSRRKDEAEALAMKTRNAYEKATASSCLVIKKNQADLSEREKAKAQIRSKALALRNALGHTEEELQRKESVLSAVRGSRKEALEKELDCRNSVGGIKKLFQKAKYEAAMGLAEEYKREADALAVQASDMEAELGQLRENLRQAESLTLRAEQEYRECESGIVSAQKAISSEEEKVSAYKSRFYQACRKAEFAKKEYEAEIRKLTGSDLMESGTVIDEAFVERLLSEDIKTATDAQVSNPWFTQRYNREREKLFGYAMRMNKEFVLSSTQCRDNFATLSQYWGLRNGDENERIMFHQEDKETMVPALFQTLFLLVPVLSSTFASVGRLLRDVRQPGVIGTLVVDEAGQAQPQMVLGALYRSRRAVIVGDPKQVEPVVTDDLVLLRKAYQDADLKPYKKKTLSVQAFADGLNGFGTYLDNGSDDPEWVGCPLLVHRRCISPMYDISNAISYHGIMKQQTRSPKPEKAEKFIFEKSQWINVKGKEKGNKNHFVDAQGQKVCELLEIAFSKNQAPDIYIISPFTTAVAGIRKYIKEYCKKNVDSKINGDYMLDYDRKRIGTVHTFQGKEADEVIFLLGCDTSEGAGGAVRWVNHNIVNVAATRAKFRLYMIGDEEAWKASPCVHTAKEIIDTFAIKEIKSILEQGLPMEEQKSALIKASAALPSVTAFSAVAREDENGGTDYSVDTSGLILGLNEEFLKTELSAEQLGKFGFHAMRDLEHLSERVKENLVLGMKLFFLLEPVYRVNRKLDASCCAVLFCKAMELRMKECFVKSLQELFPKFKVRGMGKGRERVELKSAGNDELTLGAFYTILKANKAELGRRMKETGNAAYDEAWWNAFGDKLKDCTNRRNLCCHCGLFSWKDQSFLLFDMFKKDTEKEGRSPQIGGILFESEVGKRLVQDRRRGR